jgi:hypothetical protein
MKWYGVTASDHEIFEAAKSNPEQTGLHIANRWNPEQKEVSGRGSHGWTYWQKMLPHSVKRLRACLLKTNGHH